MTRLRQRIVIVGAASLVLAPAAAMADIVFDPSNFAEAILQVTEDIHLVEQLRQEVQNGLAMVKGWNFTQLPQILGSMDIWQQVFGAAGGTYTSIAPGGALSTQYPFDPSSYANVTEAGYESMESAWDQAQRDVLIENRTVQNQTFLNLQPTAQRIQTYIEHSSAAPGATAALQAGNEEAATLIAQLQAMQAQEITDARREVELAARIQAELAYAQEQQQGVRGDWSNPPPPTSSVTDAFSLANP